MSKFNIGAATFVPVGGAVSTSSLNDSVSNGPISTIGTATYPNPRQSNTSASSSTDTESVEDEHLNHKRERHRSGNDRARTRHGDNSRRFNGANNKKKNSDPPTSKKGSKKSDRSDQGTKLTGSDHLSFEEEIFLANRGQTKNKRGQVSISHLLDFSLPSRPVNRSNAPRFTPKRQTNYGKGSGYHQTDKATFINAHYRFIVDPRGDYREQMADPNLHLPTNMVMRILISQVSSCPICLTDVPVSPRMLRCGHIFCYSCLLRFLSSEPATSITTNSTTDPKLKPKSHKECPLCFDVVDINKTKPVTFSLHDERFEVPREGEDALLRLMVRPHGSVLAVHVNSLLLPSEFETVPWYYSPGASEYARIMQGTPDYVLSEYEREIKDIRNTMIEDELMFGDAGYYAKLAISKIRDTMQMIRRTIADGGYDENKDSNISSDNSNDITSDAYNTSDICETSLLADDVEAMALADVSPPGSKPMEVPGDSIGSVEIGSLYDDTTAYFFYQTSFNSVIRYFLAPLDIKILRAAFGFYSAAPSILLVKILNVIHSEVVTLDLQKRSKYLAHLPVGTEIAFLECDWTGIISDEVLKPFSEVLRERKKKKKQKERREERDFQRARAEESAQQDELLRESGYELSVYERLYSQTTSSSTSAKRSEPPMPKSNPKPRPVSESTCASETESGSTASRRTVWGTSVVGDAPEPILDPFQRQIDLAAAQEHEGVGNGKSRQKKAKKMVLVSSGGKRLF